MSASNLAAWNIDPSQFPVAGTAIDKARFAVGYAILAPSSHNTQPWRFIVNGDELLLCADRTRSLPNIDPFDRELDHQLRGCVLKLQSHAGTFQRSNRDNHFPAKFRSRYCGTNCIPEFGTNL